MAVTQVSTIQIRYGLQTDITTLAAGELAWAVDTQRLYIGNGTVADGAPFPGITEIQTGQLDLTEVLGNYTFKGSAGGYVVTTGVDSLTPITRSFQDKIDDYINIRDFGAVGNGITDDTAAIQRAIDEVYNRKQLQTVERTRRGIRFNAGIYRIDGTLYVPPYAVLAGEGKVNTKLRFISSGIVLTTTTGADSSDPDSRGDLPQFVNFEKMSVEAVGDVHIVTIDGGQDILFNNVTFKGPKTVSRNLDSGGSGVRIRSSVAKSSNIQFINCTFKDTVHAALIDSEVGTSHIIFDRCKFNNLYDGIRVDNFGGEPQNIKVSNSTFTDIFIYAIDTDPGVNNVISTGNRYTNVGSWLTGDIDTQSYWVPVLRLRGDKNYSIGDIFDRTVAASRAAPRIEATTGSIYSVSIDDYLRSGNSYESIGRSVVLSNNSSGSHSIENFTQGIITYSISRGGEYRSGTIQVAVREDLVYNDEYVITSDFGVDMHVERTEDTLQFAWEVSADAADAVLTYQLKKLQ